MGGDPPSLKNLIDAVVSVIRSMNAICRRFYSTKEKFYILSFQASM